MDQERRITFRIADAELLAALDAALLETKQPLSSLLRDLLTGYLHGRSGNLPAPDDAHCLVELSKRFTPWDLARMQAACEGKHQPTELVSLLLAFSGGESILRQSFLDIAARRGINIKPAS